MAAALLTTALLAGIYPDGHFDTVTKLGKANVDTVIKDTIDSGKTLFVRFIASRAEADESRIARRRCLRIILSSPLAT